MALGNGVLLAEGSLLALGQGGHDLLVVGLLGAAAQGAAEELRGRAEGDAGAGAFDALADGLAQGLVEQAGSDDGPAGGGSARLVRARRGLGLGPPAGVRLGAPTGLGFSIPAGLGF